MRRRNNNDVYSACTLHSNRNKERQSFWRVLKRIVHFKTGDFARKSRESNAKEKRMLPIIEHSDEMDATTSIRRLKFEDSNTESDATKCYVKDDKNQTVMCAEDIATTADTVMLNLNMLSSVWQRLSIYHRIRFRQVNSLTNALFATLPIEFPPLKIEARDEDYDEYEIYTSNLELVKYYLAPEIFDGKTISNEKFLTVNSREAEFILNRLASRIGVLQHLWLETKKIYDFCGAFMGAIEPNGIRKKVKLQKLTLIDGSLGFNFATDQICEFITYFSDSLEHLSLNYVAVISPSRAEKLWSTVGQCHNLKYFQYETCMKDSYSCAFIVDALSHKPLKILQLGGIDQLNISDLAKITECCSVENLSILCSGISPLSYGHKIIRKTLGNIKTLLIQCEESYYSIDDFDSRMGMMNILKSMNGSSALEVVHVADNNVAQASKIMSYWLELSRETRRIIRLKLSEISQDRIDQAIGRLLRKCDNVFKKENRGNSLILSSGDGCISLLDRHAWFGEDD